MQFKNENQNKPANLSRDHFLIANNKLWAKKTLWPRAKIKANLK